MRTTSVSSRFTVRPVGADPIDVAICGQADASGLTGKGNNCAATTSGTMKR